MVSVTLFCILLGCTGDSVGELNPKIKSFETCAFALCSSDFFLSFLSFDAANNDSKTIDVKSSSKSNSSISKVPKQFSYSDEFLTYLAKFTIKLSGSSLMICEPNQSLKLLGMVVLFL